MAKDSTSKDRLENSSTNNENEIQKLRISILEKEALIKEKELNSKKRRLGALEVGIIVAIIGLMSNALVSYLNGRNEYLIEKHRLEANLILNAVGTGDIDQNKENLKFLLEAGLITINKTDLEVAIKNPETRIYFIRDMTQSINPSDSSYTNFKDFFEAIQRTMDKQSND